MLKINNKRRRQGSQAWSGWAWVALGALLLAGCAGTSGAPAASGGLMRLEDAPAQAVWTDWTPAAHAPGLLPAAFVDQVVAFDYWQIDDAQFREQAWAGAASVLDYLRQEDAGKGVLDPAQRPTATALLQAFDAAGAQGGQMDVTFVVSLHPEYAMEGLILRFYAHLPHQKVTPGLAIFLGRQEGDAAGFEGAVMWAQSGFEEAAPFTVALERDHTTGDDGGWTAARYDGLVVPGDNDTPAAADAQTTPPQDALESAADLAGAIFQQNFWDPLVGAHYVEASIQADAPLALPPGVEPALGLTVRERQLEEILRDTLFVPRVEVPAQFR